MPIRACDGTPASRVPTILRAIDGAPPGEVLRALAVFRRPYSGSDEPLATSAPLNTWLPVGQYDPATVRRASVPATYLVPTSDLRTKPLACGGGTSRGPGVCLLMPADYACFTLGEIREGRAFTRNGRYLLGVIPDGPTWVRLTSTVGALAVDNVAEQTAPGEPLNIRFEHDAPRVAVLNATRTPRLASRMAKTLIRVFGTQAGAGNASRGSVHTFVFSRRPDAVLRGAIACCAGASATGLMSAANWLNVPDDVDFVVVLGERM